MGIDSLSFEPSEELTKPNRNIRLSGWSNRTLSFHAKVYLGFIQHVTEYEIGIDGIIELDSKEMKEVAEALENWNFEESDFDPSYEEPDEPDKSVPRNTPGKTYSRYSRGPNSSQEVEDLVYLLEKYAEQDGKLVYYY